SGNERCLGNGVRMIWDRSPQGDEPATSLSLGTSLVEHTRETGILVEGAGASIETSIVRDAAEDSCAGDFGDGIAAYSDAAPELPKSALSVRATRIEKTARAGIASFGGAGLTLRSSALVGTRGVAASGATLSETLCADIGDAAW